MGELATRLAEFTAPRTPTVQVFKMPKPHQAVLMLKEDLEVAGIPYSDESGLAGDFHSLRHTFTSNLAAGGIQAKTAQELARHSTITLTMDCYSHVAREKLTSALDILPDLSKPEREAAKATGTYDATPDDPEKNLVEILPIAGAEQCASVHDNATNGVKNGDGMVRGGLEPPTHGFSVHCSTNQNADAPTASGNPESNLPSGLPFLAESDPELASVVEAWPKLPEHIKSAITTMVESSKSAD